MLKLQKKQPKDSKPDIKRKPSKKPGLIAKIKAWLGITRQHTPPIDAYWAGDPKDDIRPDGLNTVPLDHCILHNRSRRDFVRSFHIHKMPTNVTFAETLRKIFEFRTVRVSVFIKPMHPGDAVTEIERGIEKLETEELEARRADDGNYERKMSRRISDANRAHVEVDSGNMKVFKVGFILTIFAPSLEELDLLSDDFVNAASLQGIELSAYYARQGEAFKANQLTNDHEALGMLEGMKWHRMDEKSLSTIFYHVYSDFYHKKGIVIGRNLLTNKPVAFDIFDKSHPAFNMVVAGSTGSGKSAMVKVLAYILTLFGYRFVFIDSERKGDSGEYTFITRLKRGTVIEIGPSSRSKLNLFDIEEEIIFDQATLTETRTLKIADKVQRVVSTLLLLVRSNAKSGDSTAYDMEASLYMKRIFSDAVAELYRRCGLVEGVADSLYEEAGFTDGRISAGKKKKKMFTMKSLFLQLLFMRAQDPVPDKAPVYNVIIECLKDYIDELVVCTNGCRSTYSLEDFERMYKDAKMNHQENRHLDPNSPLIEEILVQCPTCKSSHIELIDGTCKFFDGETSKDVDFSKPITSLDVSGVNPIFLPVALMIASEIETEYFIKKNSENPLKAAKMVVVDDEFGTRGMIYHDFRQTVIEKYRTGRKRNVSAVTSTQSLADFNLFEDAKAIITQSEAMFIFRHKETDKNAVMELASINESYAKFVLKAGIGECLLKSGNQIAKVKVDLDCWPKLKRIVRTDVEGIKEDLKSA